MASYQRKKQSSDKILLSNAAHINFKVNMSTFPTPDNQGGQLSIYLTQPFSAGLSAVLGHDCI
jgi:hypothetical protein